MSKEYKITKNTKINKKTKRNTNSKNKTNKKRGGGLISSAVSKLSKSPALKDIVGNVASSVNPMDLLSGSSNTGTTTENIIHNETDEEKIKKRTQEIMCSKLKEIMDENKENLMNVIGEKVEKTLVSPEFTSRVENIVTSKISEVLANENGPIYTKLADVIEKSFEKVVNDSIKKSLEKHKEQLTK